MRAQMENMPTIPLPESCIERKRSGKKSGNKIGYHCVYYSGDPQDLFGRKR